MAFPRRDSPSRPDVYEMKFSVRYDVPFPYYDEDQVSRDGQTGNEKLAHMKNLAEGDQPSFLGDGECAGFSGSASNIEDKDSRNITSSKSPHFQMEKECKNLAKTLTLVELEESQGEPVVDSQIETTFSCHLQEVEMILERIWSSGEGKKGGEEEAINEKKAIQSTRWRDYLGRGGGGGGGGRRRESLVGKMSLTMSSEEKCVVTRSQSMRQPNAQTQRPTQKPVTILFDHPDDGTRKTTGARKMDSIGGEFRPRTDSIPNRRDRRSQSMRVPTGKPADRRPQHLQANDENGDFERMRTFVIDPAKPGIIINRGDSFRRRCNTGNVKVRPEHDRGHTNSKANSQVLLNKTPSSGQGLDTEINHAISTTQSRKNSSPGTPTSPDTFMTPPESLSPCTNGHVLCEIRKYDVMVLGMEGTGKTAMIIQFMTSEYCNPFQIDADESVLQDNTVSVQLDGEESRLTFHEIDNHKNEIWWSLGGDGYLIVYSIDDALSFRNAKKLVQEVRAGQATASKPVILVANKIDLERKRQVTADDGRNLAKDNDCKFVEITVALGHHVDELLVGILAQVRQSELDTLNEGQLENEVFPNVDDSYRPISNTQITRPTPRSASNIEMGLLRFSPSRQQNQPRRSSTKRRKRLSTSKTSEDNSSVSPPTSCSNLTAVGHRFVQKMFGRRRSSRSLEDLLSLA